MDGVERNVITLLNTQSPDVALRAIKLLYQSAPPLTQHKVMALLSKHFDIVPVKVTDHG